ncbi:MAG: acetyltransferase [Ectothiorhodospiraceae bacterium]|jgi:hypothetical protein
MTADDDRIRLVAEAVRQACLQEAVDAYEYGGMSGLCVEGRWDLAMDRLRSLDVDAVVREALEKRSDE